MSLKDEATPPGLLETAFLASIERAINQALRTDPASMERLAALSGHLVSLHLTLPPLAIYMLVVEDGIELYHASDAEADVSLHGSPVELAAQLFEWRTRGSAVGGPVRIRGNQQLLQSLLDIARDLRIDWGALFEPLLGGEMAQAVEHGGRQVLATGRDLLARLGQQLSNGLQRENGLLALRREVFEFNQDVDELRMDVDRLAMRIARLQSRDENPS